MKKIRIGKDIKIRWGVTIEGEVADPAVYDLTLELRDAFGAGVEVAQPTLVDGLLETTFYGKDYKRTGAYRLTLWLNKGKEGQSVVDACDAFTLVSCSCDEGGDSDLDLEVVDVATASLDVGGGSGGGSGVSDYAQLSNKPRINDVVLNGNKTAEELGLQPKGEYALKSELPEVPDVSEFITEATADGRYQAKGSYLTQTAADNRYAKKSEIPTNYLTAADLEGLATEEYVDSAVNTQVVNHTATTAEIAPNVLNVWGEVASLNLSFAEGGEGVVNEYMVQFASGATATTLVLPDTIQWMAAPNVQANKTYQLSVVNNLGIIAEFG